MIKSFLIDQKAGQINKFGENNFDTKKKISKNNQEIEILEKD